MPQSDNTKNNRLYPESKLLPAFQMPKGLSLNLESDFKHENNLLPVFVLFKQTEQKLKT